jgi:integrating conjugative element membrane protein (TIGR03747 family)
MSYASERPYPLEGMGATPLFGTYSVPGSILRWLRWTVTLCVLVLIVDLVCVMLIWDDGSDTLARLVVKERQQLGLEPGSAAGRTVHAIMALAHEWVFVKTGLEDWIRMQRTGFLQALVNGLWFVIDTAMQGMQLFALRFAVLVLSLPFFLMVAVTAVADGVYGWLMRRSGGARESGFIYHRAKRAFPAIIVLLWLVYLVPPVVMDPRWVLPPFLVLFAIVLRLRVAYFKKHI